MHIAIIGCGQLARMMALDGWRMGYTFTFAAFPGESVQPVEGLGEIVEVPDSLRGEALFKALGEPAVVTVEREDVDTDMLRDVQQFCNVYPSPEAIEKCKHRGVEKSFLRDIGVPTAPFALADCADSVAKGVAEVGLPVIIKSCQQGYDGRGQWRLKTQEDLDTWLEENQVSMEYIVEGVISFEREISTVSVRAADGRCAFYPAAENHHENGILLTSIAPAAFADDALKAEAQQITQKILDALDYTGVLSVEFFVTQDQRLLVNEMAPRVHNSGHWTQAAGVCSQFANHLLGITDQPLGETNPVCHTAMVNLLGKEVDKDLPCRGNVQVHLYNKSIRPGRKVGHINLWDIDRGRLEQQMLSLKESIYQD
ncbi:5-(carboxyamino)imidazole ribonucleotide synthase [Neptuniibacter halophilus]|uniref:5-(carboxyamino)imidazole ribonucleotide synthase n=1 Tax=Neptuniibacter halophilus TaxID=651666 RepID=UPI00257443A7|nr:5-(carboxyamino)imidazole ribonucleotide synthase [Neptuniibacter halophilus]